MFVVVAMLLAVACIMSVMLILAYLKPVKKIEPARWTPESVQVRRYPEDYLI